MLLIFLLKNILFDLCQYFVDNGSPTASAADYPARKRNQQNYVDKVRACIEGLRTDNKPQSIQVVIEKIN